RRRGLRGRGRLRRRGLRGRGLPRRRALLRRTLRPLLRQELEGPRRGDPLDGVILAQRRVRRAVRDIRAEAPVLPADRLLRLRIITQLLERSRRRLAAALLGLRVDLQRLVERDVEDLLLALQRPRVRPLLEVRAVATVLRGDGRALGVLAHGAGQGQQAQRLLERHGRGLHRLEERGGARFGLLRTALGLLLRLRQHLGHVGAEAAGLRDDRVPGLRIRAQLAVAGALRADELAGRFLRQLV